MGKKRTSQRIINANPEASSKDEVNLGEFIDSLDDDPSKMLADEEDYNALNISLSPNQKRFLICYAQIGVIKYAANAAGFGYLTHFSWMRKSQDYRTAFELCREFVADRLEREAIRRAVEGIERMKFHQGEAIMDPRYADKNGESTVPYVERQYSDTLLIVLLKGLRPDVYKEKIEQNTNINVQTDGMTEDELVMEEQALGISVSN